MIDETSDDQTTGNDLICHCCGSPAEAACPICGVVHCARCQGDRSLSGASYIPLGFCPECRALVSRGIETEHTVAGQLASGLKYAPGAGPESEGEGFTDWRESVEFSFLVLSEFNYLAKRSRVPLRGVDAINEVIFGLLERLVEISSKNNPEDSPFISDAWTHLSQEFGRIAIFLRVGEAILAGSADISTTELQNDSEEAIRGLFTIMLRERCIEFLTPPTRRMIEQRWVRLADLFARLLSRSGGAPQDYHRIRAAMGHLSELLNLLPMVLALSKHQTSQEMFPAVYESLRFELHAALSDLHRTGARSPRLSKYLAETRNLVEEWLEKRRSSPSFSPLQGQAYDTYLKASKRSFDLDLKWSIAPPPREPKTIQEARSWAWTALCAGHLSGHFSQEAIGNLWINLMADMDRRLMELPQEERDRRLPFSSLAGDSALFDVARLLNQAGVQGHGMWEASLVAHSVWSQMERGGAYPDERSFGFYWGLFESLEKHFPWALRYLANFRVQQEGQQAASLPEPATVQESDAWAALSNMKGTKVFGEFADMKNSVWVLFGNSGEGRPAAFPEKDVVIDIGATAEGLAEFDDGQGWRYVTRLCAGRSQSSQRGCSLVMVLEFGGQDPVLIQCGMGDPEGMSRPEGISMLHDPDMMLVPAHIQEAMEKWRRMCRAGRETVRTPSLFLANPRLLARAGSLDVDWKGKNST